MAELIYKVRYKTASSCGTDQTGKIRAIMNIASYSNTVPGEEGLHKHSVLRYDNGKS